jgi:hypothetical protein
MFFCFGAIYLLLQSAGRTNHTRASSDSSNFFSFLFDLNFLQIFSLLIGFVLFFINWAQILM